MRASEEHQVSQHSQSGRRQGPVAVLTLLLGLLVGLAGGTGVQSQFDRGAQLTLGDGALRNATLRAARSADQDSEADEPSAPAPSASGVVTELVALRPSGATLPAGQVSIPAASQFSYRARAPPAA